MEKLLIGLISEVIDCLEDFLISDIPRFRTENIVNDI